MLKKDCQNPRSFSLVLDEKDATQLRHVCEVTGMSATSIMKAAIHAYLPSMQIHVEAMRFGLLGTPDARTVEPVEPVGDPFEGEPVVY